MERCLTKNPDINLVYTINEPTAVGANAALKAAGKTATIVSIDGGCAGVAAVKSGVIGAAAQYPLKMAELGIQAIAQIATGGAKPSTSPGLDFYDTGVALVTDKKAGSVTIVSSDEVGRSAGAAPHEFDHDDGRRSTERRPGELSRRGADTRPADPAPAPRAPWLNRWSC